MTLIPSLELILPTETIRLSLGQSLDDLLKILKGKEVSRHDDCEMCRTYLRIVEEGVELLFQDGFLSTIFLYPTGGPGGCGEFKGETDRVTRDVIEKLDENTFSVALEKQGFWPTKRQYPFAVDRLNNEFRIRLEKRSGTVFIMIDDGAMVR